MDGAPTKATSAVLYDNLDFMHGVEAFINSFPAASLAAMRRGFLSIGVEDNDVLAFPELMDSASLFLTANCGVSVLNRGAADPAPAPGPS